MKYLLTLAILVLANPSQADIWAQTTVKYYYGGINGRLIDTHILLTTSLRGSWSSVLVSCSEAAFNLAEFFGSHNPISATSTSLEFRDSFDQCQESTFDKEAYGRISMMIGPERNYDTVVVSFRVQSDHDPVNIYASPSVRLSTTNLTPTAYNVRSGTVSVTLRPGQQNQPITHGGIYFDTKETDCAICLGIRHGVTLSIRNNQYGPVANPVACQQAKQELTNIEIMIERNLSEQRERLASQNPTIRAAFESYEKALNICRKQNRVDPAGNCNDLVTDHCPNTSFGLSDNSCQIVGQLKNQLDELISRQKSLVLYGVDKACENRVIYIKPFSSVEDSRRNSE